MSNQREITMHLDALSIYYYLRRYSDLENEIKGLFIKTWPEFNEEFKQRIMFYQGGLGLKNGYIEYDTYSTVTQHQKFDVMAMLNKLTLNQIIKLERKENQIRDLQFEVPSLQNKKIVYPCLDCILKLLNMRNILAHKLSDLNFKNKDYIDVLNNGIIRESNLEWLNDFDLNLLSESARCIISNYIYMDIIYQKLGRDKNVETVDNG
jgi:predicted small secreted protein